jgi:cysteine desulfurase/selenocysteine lyase
LQTTSKAMAEVDGRGFGRANFDVAKVRADFPILRELVHGKPLVYLDSANTSQKPEAVIRATDDYYRHANANAPSERARHAGV